MAFMEKLRHNILGVFGTIVLFVILIIFLWGDASQGGAGAMNYDAAVAGSVNGEDIPMEEFNTRVQEMSDQQRQQNPDADINNRQIEEQVWNGIVQEKILEQSAKRLGVYVTDKQLAEILLNDPPQQLKQMFTDSTGIFQQSQYIQFMTNVDGFLATQQVPEDQAKEIRNMVVQIQDQVRLQTMVGGVRNVVGALYPPSPLMLKEAYDIQNSKASGSFILLNASLVPDSEVQVSDEEAKSYYESHKAQYMRKASRTLRYSMLRLGPSAQDSQKVQTRFRKYSEGLAKGTTQKEKSEIFGQLAQDLGTAVFSGYGYTPRHEIPAALEARLDSANAHDIIGPIRIDNRTLYVNIEDIRDSGDTWVKAQHILLRTPPDSTEAGKAAGDSIMQEAEKIAAEARSGANFEELVTQHSADQASVADGGNVGWFNKETSFVPEFKEAALKGSVGQIIGPVKTQYGYHIIKVTDRTTVSYKLRAIAFDITVSSATKNLLRRKANELRERLLDGENFDTVAADLELQVLDAPALTSSNQQVAGSYSIGNFAYEADLGDVSKIITLPDDALVVAKLTEVTPAGPAPFDEVKDQVVAAVRTKKKVAKLQDRAKQVRAQLNGTDSLSIQARSIDSTLIVRSFTDLTKGGQFPDIGADAHLSNAVFSMKPGEISQPIKGERGYYIAQVDSVQLADESKFAADTDFRKQTLSQKRQTVFGLWFQEQLDNASITRNWDR